MVFPLAKSDFPDVITPVTAETIPGLTQRLCAVNADTNYARLSSQLVFLTGYEHAHGKNGAPYTRNEWEDVLRKCLNHLNQELTLGLDPEMIEVLTLCYTVLADTPRYNNESLISRAAGENTAVHSLHTMLQVQHLYQRTLEKGRISYGDVEFFRSFQLNCLMVAVHDLGEMLGEAGTLNDVAAKGTVGVKDKTAFERGVVDYAVRLAVQTVIDRKSRARFYKAMDDARQLMNIHGKGAEKSDEVMAAELQEKLGRHVPLSLRAEKVFGFIKECWEWVEEPEKSRRAFLGHVAGLCERMQSIRHVARHADSARSPVCGADGYLKLEPTASFLSGYRLLVDADYYESKLGLAAAASDKRINCEKALTVQLARRVYETRMRIISCAGEAFFVDPLIKETQLHSDGTALTLEETAQRTKEMALAAQVATTEARSLLNAGRQRPLLMDSSVLRADFSGAAYVGWTAMTRSQALDLYRNAIALEFVPGTITVGGREKGVVLMRDRPPFVTRTPSLDEAESGAIKAEVAQILAPLRPA